MTNESKSLIEYATNLAHETALHSICLKKKVGCVIVDLKNGGILTTGFGGPKVDCGVCVRKTYEWQQDGCWSVHAEMRAVLSLLSMNHGHIKNPQDLVAVVTHGPCDQCLKLLNLYGIPLVIYDIEYHNDYSKWDGKIQVKSMKEILNG